MCCAGWKSCGIDRAVSIGVALRTSADGKVIGAAKSVALCGCRKRACLSISTCRELAARSTAELLHGLRSLYDAARKAGLSKRACGTSRDRFSRRGKEPHLAPRPLFDRLGTLRDGHRFLVTIDEFELIEEQIDAGRIDPQLLSVFRGVVQTYPWFVMAFVDCTDLEELRHDYWNRCLDRCPPSKVSFQSNRRRGR